MNQSNVKAEKIRMLDALPDNLTWEGLQYHIYVRQKIERALEDIDSGRTMSQKEVEQHFKKLMKKWAREYLGHQRPHCAAQSDGRRIRYYLNGNF